MLEHIYKEKNVSNDIRKVKGESDDPYIEYLIEKANIGDIDAYEELKNMDLEKTLNLVF